MLRGLEAITSTQQAIVTQLKRLVTQVYKVPSFHVTIKTLYLDF